MSLVTTFGYTNDDTEGHPISLMSNYSLLKEDPGVVVLDNKTCPLDQPEQVTIKGMYTNKVSSELAYKPKQSIAGPESSSQFTMRLDLMAKTVESTTGEIVEENPLSAYFVVRVPRTANLSDDMVVTAFRRMSGLTFDNDGNSRLPDFRRLALRPTHD